MSVEETTVPETVSVQVVPTVYVQVMMPSGVLQVFERPIYAEVAAVGPQGASGPPGVNGSPGAPGQSAILGTWHGAWFPTHAPYPTLAMVQHQGSTWLNASAFNTTASPNAEVPGVHPLWELVAAKGADGAPGQDMQPFKYVHTQMTPDSVWTVIHGLGGFPNVTSVDSSNSEIVGDLDYIDINTVQISFASATGGKAYIS
jgi:hypothetical protein